jgi:hypothetical protein
MAVKLGGDFKFSLSSMGGVVAVGDGDVWGDVLGWTVGAGDDEDGCGDALVWVAVVEGIADDEVVVVAFEQPTSKIIPVIRIANMRNNRFFFSIFSP